jgi:hypothetical protein
MIAFHNAGYAISVSSVVNVVETLGCENVPASDNRTLISSCA